MSIMRNVSSGWFCHHEAHKVVMNIWKPLGVCILNWKCSISLKLHIGCSWKPVQWRNWNTSIASNQGLVTAAIFAFMEWSYKAGKRCNAFVHWLHHHGGSSDPHPISQAEPVTWGTKREAGQSLGWFWFTNPLVSCELTVHLPPPPLQLWK